MAKKTPNQIVQLRFSATGAGGHLWAARSGSGFTYSEIARRSGISRAHIRKVESGAGITINKLVTLAFSLGLPPWIPLFYSISSHVDASLLPDIEGQDMERIARTIEDAAMILILPDAREAEPYTERNPAFLGAIAIECSDMDWLDRQKLIIALREEPISFLRERGFFDGVCEGNEMKRKNDLRLFEPSDTDNGMKSRWEKLRSRIGKLVERHGAQKALAEKLGVSHQAVGQWVHGQTAPAAETVLTLLEWVTAEEAKQKEPAGAVTPTGQMTRTKQNTVNEKPSPNRKRE